MIHDLDFVCPDDIDIALLVAPAGLFFVHLEGGISTRLYLSMLKYRQQITENQRNDEALEQLKYIALKIIQEDRNHSNMTIEDLHGKLDNFLILKTFVSSVYKAATGIANLPSLRLPDLDKGSRQSKKRIEIQSDNHEIMSDIAFVMTHTANTFSDIMDMPYITFAAILKSLMLSEALKNPEYREAYEKQQLRDGTIKRNTKLDYEGLKGFAANL